MPCRIRAGRGRRDRVWYSVRWMCRVNRAKHSLMEAITKLKIFVLNENKPIIHEVQSWLLNWKDSITLLWHGLWWWGLEEVRNGCTNDVLRGDHAGMNVDGNQQSPTKHLLTANTSETCASDLLAGAEPHSRWHLTTTAFVQVAKVPGAEQNVMPWGNPQGQHSYTEITVFICFLTQKNSCTTHPPKVPSLTSPLGYKNISRNANSSSSFKTAFLDNIEEDHSYTVWLPLLCVHITRIRSPWALLVSLYLLSLLIFWVGPGCEEMKVKSNMVEKGYLTLDLHMKRAECFIPCFVCNVMLY